MSLSDYVKYLRAAKGGVTPWEIAEATGVPAGEVHLIEVKHRRVGEDDATLEKLAGYFSVPVSDLASRRDSYRKLLTSFLAENQRAQRSISLKLENGEEVGGLVDWYSREAVALKPHASDDPYIVQRGWVASWLATEDEA